MHLLIYFKAIQKNQENENRIMNKDTERSFRNHNEKIIYAHTIDL